MREHAGRGRGEQRGKIGTTIVEKQLKKPNIVALTTERIKSIKNKSNHLLQTTMEKSHTFQAYEVAWKQLCFFLPFMTVNK